MLVNFTRRDGENLVIEQIDEPVDFEGSGTQEGVLVTFPLDGRDVTARIIKVIAPSSDDPSAEPVIEVELVNRAALDAEAKLANLPPKDNSASKL
jgi:hypothetical protein